MADNKIIAATVEVNTQQATANIKALSAEVKQADAGIGKVGDTSKKAAGGVDSATSSFGKLKDGIGALPGPLGAAQGATGSLISSFKALLANPIGIFITAIVAAVTLLYKSFTNTFEGGQKVEQVFAGIKAAASSLFENLDKIGRALIKVFSFDFSGAKKEIQGVVDAAAGAANKAANFTKQLQGIAKEQRQNDFEQVERQAKIAELKEKAGDSSASIQERIKAAKELQKESKQNSIDDLDLAKRTAEAEIGIRSLSENEAKKNADEINKFRIAQKKGEVENLKELKQVNKLVAQAEKEQQQEVLAAQKEAAAKAKEERAKLTAFNKQLKTLEQSNDLAQVKEGYDREVAALKQKGENQKDEIKKQVSDGQLTKKQAALLTREVDEAIALQQAVIDKKKSDDLIKKEADLQKEILAIRNKIKLESIKDADEKELAVLKQGYDDKLAAAIERYKEDEQRLFEVRIALQEEFDAQEEAIKEKQKNAKAKKEFEKKDKGFDETIGDKESTDFKSKRAAVDADLLLNQEAFDAKLIQEDDFNKKKKALSAARIAIDGEEGSLRSKQAAEAIATLDNVAAAIGKQTQVGKGLAAASALINTYKGASEVIAAKSTLPSPFDTIAKVANVAAIIATGIKTVKAIYSVQVPTVSGGGGGAAPSAPSITAPAPLTPTTTSTRLDAASLNGIGNAVGTSRAYVLDSDVNNNRERNVRLNRAARLGG
jgi:hypothetical protein